MNIPGLGEVEKDERFGDYYSQRLSLALLNRKQCRVVIDGYDDDENKKDFHLVIANLLTAPFSVLKDAEPYIFQYYQDMNSYRSPADEEFLVIESPNQVWKHIQLADNAVLTRRAYGDQSVYVSLECNCDWEREHGLQIVLRDGAEVVKVGPYDGHLTNSDAYADDAFENVIYR